MYDAQDVRHSERGLPKRLDCLLVPVLLVVLPRRCALGWARVLLDKRRLSLSLPLSLSLALSRRLGVGLDVPALRAESSKDEDRLDVHPLEQAHVVDDVLLER